MYMNDFSKFSGTFSTYSYPPLVSVPRGYLLINLVLTKKFQKLSKLTYPTGLFCSLILFKVTKSKKREYFPL